MANSDIVNKVIMKISFSDEIPQKESSLKFDLGIDSIRLVELIFELENELGITFDISDLDPNRIGTVGDNYTICEGA